eukprot:3291159-Rhodomonas_salina.1
MLCDFGKPTRRPALTEGVLICNVRSSESCYAKVRYWHVGWWMPAHAVARTVVCAVLAYRTVLCAV